MLLFIKHYRSGTDLKSLCVVTPLIFTKTKRHRKHFRPEVMGHAAQRLQRPQKSSRESHTGTFTRERTWVSISNPLSSLWGTRLGLPPASSKFHASSYSPGFALALFLSLLFCVHIMLSLKSFRIEGGYCFQPRRL